MSKKNWVYYIAFLVIMVFFVGLWGKIAPFLASDFSAAPKTTTETTAPQATPHETTKE